MPNRSREENMKLLMEAFKKAGPTGLSVDEAKEILFGNDSSKKSVTKKILEEMTYKSILKFGNKLKNRYVIILSLE